MKKIEGSWAVYFVKAPRINHPVIKYLNKKYNMHFQGSADGVYYGVTLNLGACHSCDKTLFAKILTEEEFLKLIKTMTKQEIENYKDFKKGDILKQEEYFQVVEVLGDLIFKTHCYKTPNNINITDINPYGTMTKYKAYKDGWRLYVPEEKIEEEILELTLEDIASKYGKKVEEIKIKK